MEMEAPFAACRVSICGIEDLDGLAAAGVTHVLSMLDPGWPAPSFDAFPAHRRLDLRFHDIVDPLPGLRAPNRADVESLLNFARPMAASREAHLLVHCQKGLSRSTAALALILAEARPDRDADAVLGEIMRLRPRAWPNLRIIELGDQMLGRGGGLIAAVARCYRQRLAGRPQLADGMIEMGRVRELLLAEQSGHL
jgi:predicted protein tyrosine phosphatase